MAKKITLTFTIEQELAADMWFVKFAISAKNEQNALSKAQDWAHYHSFTMDSIRVRTATETEAANMLHNEYIR